MSAYVRELPSFDRENWVRVLRGMIGEHYDWLAGLSMRTGRETMNRWVLPFRRNRYTCSSSVAYVLSEVGCAHFPQWQNTIPPDLDEMSTFGTIGCDYGPVKSITT